MNLSELKQRIRSRILAIQSDVGDYKAARMDELAQLMGKGELSSENLMEFIRQSAEGLDGVNQAFKLFQAGLGHLHLEDLPEPFNGNGMNHSDQVALGIPGEPDPDTPFERVSPPTVQEPLFRNQVLDVKKVLEDHILTYITDNGWVSSHQIGSYVADRMVFLHRYDVSTDEKKKALARLVKNALTRLKRWKKLQNNKTKGKFYALIEFTEPAPCQ